ncbi:hypothetical protein GCM10009765_31970 [Fodinicola feengrottensis]|uniref:SMI1/KNR4 family protein n=1 Tax=Fodinicola feengrottensis TaxID=435914 RepID=A0ABP4T0N1_9ACTN
MPPSPLIMDAISGTRFAGRVKEDLSMEPKRGWVGTDLGKFRACDGTYQLYSYDELPPLDESLFSGAYEWLGTPADEPMAITTGVQLAPVEVVVSLNGETNDDLMDEWDRRYKREQELLAQAPAQHPVVLAELVSSLTELGFTLPAAFTTFLGNEKLLSGVSSCTCCTWDIPAKPSPSPLADGAYLVRFMRDSQDLLFWYLHLDQENPPFVVVSSFNFETAADLDPEEALDQLWFCGPEFEEFLYRFWIENEIWFATNEEKKLTPTQLAYVEHYPKKKKKKKKKKHK